MQQAIQFAVAHRRLLGRGHPGLRARLVDDGALRRFVTIYVNDEDGRFLAGLATPLAAGDTVTILPAVAGGAGGAR